MKTLLALILFVSTTALAQPKFELTANGFTPVEIARPAKTNEKLIEASKAWAPFYNKQQNDVYNVTERSLSIDAKRDNAFFYRHLGEIYSYNIKYSLEVVFGEKTCTLNFVIKEIYAKKTLTKMTVADFFTTDGKLRDDFPEAKPSLEKTANNILRSYAEFISN